MTAAEPLVLTEVTPIYGDTYETAGYRSCDFCYESACEDIWAGVLDESRWRTFYALQDGTIVCSRCLEKGGIE